MGHKFREITLSYFAGVVVRFGFWGVNVFIFASTTSVINRFILSVITPFLCCQPHCHIITILSYTPQFAVGWWLWIDAHVYSAHIHTTVPVKAQHYVPGIVGSVALLMYAFFFFRL
jgi:hypothetical protein